MLWDVARREPLAVAKGGVGSVAFSLDGKTLAAGYDGGVVLWDVARREPLAVAEGGGRGVAFSPDGKTLAAGAASATTAAAWCCGTWRDASRWWTSRWPWLIAT